MALTSHPLLASVPSMGRAIPVPPGCALACNGTAVPLLVPLNLTTALTCAPFLALHPTQGTT